MKMTHSRYIKSGINPNEICVAEVKTGMNGNKLKPNDETFLFPDSRKGNSTEAIQIINEHQ